MDDFPQLRAEYGDDAIVHFGGSHKFLSSFDRTPVVLDGVAYPTAEHAFQAQKTTDAAMRARIAAARTPKAAQELAREMPKALVTPGWFDEGLRDEAMKKVIDAKVRPGRGCMACATACAAFPSPCAGVRSTSRRSSCAHGCIARTHR